MQGYIYLQTHPDYPGQIRVLQQEQQPAPDDYLPARLHYIARFKNAHIAYMHVHDTLKRQLVSLNERRYSSTLADAIAAIEAEDLQQERIWIDPALAEDDSLQQQIAEKITLLQQKQQRINRRFLVVGSLAILLLMFILFGGIWRV